MATCKFCGKVFRTDHNLENHQLLSHRDKAQVTWTDDAAPAPTPKKAPAKADPEPVDHDDDEEDDFWGTD